MKPAQLLLAVIFFSIPGLAVADDDTPVPTEIQTLAESFFAALKSGDEAAISACWHTPEALGKREAEEAVKEAATSPTPIDASKEGEREVKKQTKNLVVTLKRVAQMRALITKHFGDVGQLQLASVEIDPDEDAPAEAPAYDNLDIRLLASEGTHLKISMDDVIRIDGAWKFIGRIDDDLTIELPDEE